VRRGGVERRAGAQLLQQQREAVVALVEQPGGCAGRRPEAQRLALGEEIARVGVLARIDLQHDRLAVALGARREGDVAAGQRLQLAERPRVAGSADPAADVGGDRREVVLGPEVAPADAQL
jgi:hypothetical protein